MWLLKQRGLPREFGIQMGQYHSLDDLGMERSDTRKKAFANGRTFRQRNPDAYFCIVTNALPANLVGYRNRDVNAIFDVTKIDRIKALYAEIRSILDVTT